MGASQSFKKSERLIDRNIIDALFNKKGKSLRSGPLLFAFYMTELKTDFPAQVMISVSKKKFNKAHDRNRVKRLIKEAYRLHKQKIYDYVSPTGKQFALALLYLDKEEKSFQDIESHLLRIINEFTKTDI